MYPGFSYIGSKGKLLDFLKMTIEDYTNKKLNQISSFLDGFAGSGIVSYFMILEGINNVISNDIQYYSYIVSSILTKKDLDIEKLYAIIYDLNNLKCENASTDDFIYWNYTPIENICERMYLTNMNGLKVDRIRKKIEELYAKKMINQTEYKCLIKVLLYAVVKVSNTSSTYGAYLKQFKVSAQKDLFLDKTLIDKLNNDNNTFHKCYNKDIHILLDNLQDLIEIAYFDPPYNGRQYNSNYFFLENIAKYDNPKIKGKTGLRVDTSTNSNFCSKVKVIDEFMKLINKVNSKYIFISYNSESIVPKETIVSLLKTRYNNVKCYEYEYKRFKCNNRGEQNDKVIEFLFAGTLISE